MRFESKFTVQSVTQPGVFFEVRVLNSIQRAKLDLQNLEARVKYSEIYAEIGRLPKPPEGDPPPADPDLIEREKLRISADCILKIDIKPATIRAGLLKIEGLEIDGLAATTESLIESGPSGLIDEIWSAINNEAGLTEEQRKNSQSPSISAAPEAGQESTTNAATAGTSATT